MTSGSEPDDRIYKILRSAEWDVLQRDGTFAGSADDVRDGFIHLSTSAQVPGTLAKHFAGERSLVVVALSASAFGDALRWEPSRDGQLFPHLYEEMEGTGIMGVWHLAGDVDGQPVLPEGWPDVEPQHVGHVV